MPSDENAPERDDSLLESVLDRYLEELAEGREPDQEAYLREHPELADTLRGLFRTLELVESSAAPPPPADLGAGRTIGDFRIVREIDRGGMGIVYEAVQTSLDRRVALKILPSGLFASGNALERFHREAATVAQLHHTSIVPVYAVGEEGGVHWFAMQYIEGGSLAGLLSELRERRERPEPDHFRRVARWGRQIADALAHAHEQGTIHRDVKPSNLLLDEQDDCWITDFGLARTSARATITASGDIVGTARYMSPEQASGSRGGIDLRTDVYSLGATLYELLTLTPAVDGESREEVLVRITTDRVVPLRQRDSRIPRDLETIVGKCLEKERERRYADAGEVAAELRRFLAGESIRARRPSPLVVALRHARRHRARIGAAAALLALVAVVLVVYLSGRHAEAERKLDEAFDEIYFEQDFARAEDLLDEAESLGNESVHLWLYRGLMYLEDLLTQKALPSLAEALERAPEDVEARLAMAMAVMYGGDYAHGLARLDAVSDDEIHTALGWLIRGNALSASQHSRALEAYGKAIDLRSDFVPAIAARARYRGFRLLSEGNDADREPMLADCQALTVFRPNSSRAYAVQGHGWHCAAAFAGTRPELADRRDEWLENARLNLEAATSIGREDPFALDTQGTFLRYIGDFAGAEERFARATEINARRGAGGNYRILYKQAMMQWVLDRPERALGTIDQARVEAPEFYPLSLIQAVLLAELGRIEEAPASCREVMQRYDHHANARMLAMAVLGFIGAREEYLGAVDALATEAGTELTSEDALGDYSRLACGFYAGELSAEEVLEATAKQPGLRCELAFLIGMHRLAIGERVGGLATLRTCFDTQVFRFFEHRFAQIVLYRAAVDPEWPPWLGGE